MEYWPPQTSWFSPRVYAMSKLTVDVADALSTIPYLRELPQGERRSLAAQCSIRTLCAGERAFMEGDRPDGVFLIVAGRVRLMRSSPGGREQVLHEEGPGMTLGEVPVFDGEGYVGSAVATEDATVLFVPRAALLDSLRRNPASASEVIRILARRVRTFAALVEDLSLRDVPQRTAGYLLREAARTGSASFVLPGTRDVMAAHLGTVREQVSRALSQLKRDGVIELNARRVRILDAGRLRSLAGDR